MEQRRIAMELVPLGEDAHAQLVEWGAGKRAQGLLLPCDRLVHPAIASRSDGEMARAVGMGEVETTGHLHWSMVADGSQRGDELAAPVRQGRPGRNGFPGPAPLAGRHEAHLPDAVAIMEAAHGQDPRAIAEAYLQAGIAERVGRAVRRREYQFVHAPAFADILVVRGMAGHGVLAVGSSWIMPTGQAVRYRQAFANISISAICRS